MFHSGCSRLINDLLHQAALKLKLDRVLLSGVSMGGNILLKMVGEWGSSCPDWVLGAAVISPLVDLPGPPLQSQQFNYGVLICLDFNGLVGKRGVQFA